MKLITLGSERAEHRILFWESTSRSQPDRNKSSESFTAVVVNPSIFNNYSPEWRGIAIIIHGYSPTLRRIIVLVDTTQFYSNSQLYFLMNWISHDIFPSGSRQEVNVT